MSWYNPTTWLTQQPKPPEPEPESLSDSFERLLHEKAQAIVREAWGDYVDPRTPFYDDGERWVQMGQGTENQSGLAYGQSLDDARKICRELAATNGFAICGHENRKSYIVGTGFTFKAASKKAADASDADIEALQEFLDDFCYETRWHKRQQEIQHRLDRDGECFLRFFEVDGKLKIRFVEPQQIKPETGKAKEYPAGIRTDPEDAETTLEYSIATGTSDGTKEVFEYVDAERIQHRKSNVDCSARRGMPLYWPVRANLERAQTLLRNMSRVAAIQSAIAFIRKHEGPKAVGQDFSSQRADLRVAPPVNTGGGAMTTNYKEQRFNAVPPGAIFDSSNKISYEYLGGTINGANFVLILQAELRAIAARLAMPEFMFTSDASNATYSSTMVAEGPAVRMFERLQKDMEDSDLEILWRAVEIAIASGNLPASVYETCEIQVGRPELAVRNKLEEEQIRQLRFAAHILSPQTWSTEAGLEYEQEQENIKADDELHPERQLVPLDQMPGDGSQDGGTGNDPKADAARKNQPQAKGE